MGCASNWAGQPANPPTWWRFPFEARFGVVFVTVGSKETNKKAKSKEPQDSCSVSYTDNSAEQKESVKEVRFPQATSLSSWAGAHIAHMPVSVVKWVYCSSESPRFRIFFGIPYLGSRWPPIVWFSS